MPPKLFLATKAVIVYQNKILLLRESGAYEEGTNQGRYDLPGGRLQPGERFDDALKREVLEETGLRITVGAPITVREWRPVVAGELWQVVGIFFLCQTETDRVRLSADHDEHTWVTPDELGEVALIEGLEPVFAAYRALHDLQTSYT